MFLNAECFASKILTLRLCISRKFDVHRSSNSMHIDLTFLCRFCICFVFYFFKLSVNWRTVSGRAKSACSTCSGLTHTACSARLRRTPRTRRDCHDQQHSLAAALSSCALPHAQCDHTRSTRWVQCGAIARDARKVLACSGMARQV
jgi:hypothetical protein